MSTACPTAARVADRRTRRALSALAYFDSLTITYGKTIPLRMVAKALGATQTAIAARIDAGEIPAVRREIERFDWCLDADAARNLAAEHAGLHPAELGALYASVRP